MIIQGIALQLDTPNANGHTIPVTESENILKSIVKAKLRICNRDDQHGCDTSPFAEIGHIKKAWMKDSDVVVIAEITDEIARKKINDKTWKNGWSIYALGKQKQESFVDVNIQSLTLVENPAWKKATFEVVQADTKAKNINSIKNIHNDSEKYIKFFASYEVITMNDELEKLKAEYSTIKIENEALKSEMSVIKANVLEKEKANEVLKSEIEKLKIGNTNLKASVITEDALEKIVCASLEKQKQIDIKAQKLIELKKLVGDDDIKAFETMSASTLDAVLKTITNNTSKKEVKLKASTETNMNITEAEIKAFAKGEK